MRKYEKAQNQVRIYERYVKCQALWKLVDGSPGEIFGTFLPYIHLMDSIKAVGLTSDGVYKVASEGFRAEVKALYDQACNDCIACGLMSHGGEWL